MVFAALLLFVLFSCTVSPSHDAGGEKLTQEDCQSSPPAPAESDQQEDPPSDVTELGHTGNPYLRSPVKFITPAAGNSYLWRVVGHGNEVLCLVSDARPLVSSRGGDINDPVPLRDPYTFATSSGEISLYFEQVGHYRVLLEVEQDGATSRAIEQVDICEAPLTITGIEVFSGATKLSPDNIIPSAAARIRLRARANTHQRKVIDPVYWKVNGGPVLSDGKAITTLSFVLRATDLPRGDTSVQASPGQDFSNPVTVTLRKSS